MTTSHANCTHPATKAARAACRRAATAAPSPEALALLDACTSGAFITIRHLTGKCASLTHPTTGHWAEGPTHDASGAPIPALHTDPLDCAKALAARDWTYSTLCRAYS